MASDRFNVSAAYAAMMSRTTVHATGTRGTVAVGMISEIRATPALAQVSVWTGVYVVWTDVDKVRLATDEEVRDAEG